MGQERNNERCKEEVIYPSVPSTVVVHPFRRHPTYWYCLEFYFFSFRIYFYFILLKHVHRHCMALRHMLTFNSKKKFNMQFTLFLQFCFTVVALVSVNHENGWSIGRSRMKINIYPRYATILSLFITCIAR